MKHLHEVEAMVTHYDGHPAHQNYPLVGVSYEQTVAYCAWRSKRVNEVLFVNENRGSKMARDTQLPIPEKVRYRLPTKEEWELAAVGQLDILLFQHQTPKQVAYYTREMFEQRFTLQDPERFLPLARWGTKAQKSKLFQMIGNVAEMTNIAGIAKGGSYMHAIGDCLPEVDLSYHGPTYWLGSRCVAEFF
ncbi:MAG: formylglycine-generating enzyme family protein [Bacteroidia bacterium]